jgi:AraC family transcriptional regulator of adaptative response/methylated-DNA-[protein]-cysteine methyltransferase
MNHYDTIAKAIELITTNKLQSPSDEELAAQLGISASHLRKVFTEWVGITPKQFSRYLSLEYSKGLLEQRKNHLKTSLQSGLSSSGRLHDLFVDIEAMTPGEYQNHGENLAISYSTFDSKFGPCLIASTPKGICNIIFADADNAVTDLRGRWKNAKLVPAFSVAGTVESGGGAKEKANLQQVIDYLTNLKPTSKIKLHLHGTNFQIKVWEALLSTPHGQVSTYGAIAEQAGYPGAFQATGGAVSDNPIAYLIPCHRVLKSTGEISGYRWGVERKRAMLGWEAIG